EDTIEIISGQYGETVDLAHLPQNDPVVYDCLQKADTVGLFQVESRAQMSCLPRLRPTHFYDIVVEVAIIRPGPIVGQMVNPYLERRQGRAPVSYPHPSLEPVLERTLGVPLFQEQLLRIAMVVASFSGGEAEELRRAMGFKRSEKRMREIEAKLRAGMTRNGITAASQEEIILAITSFALYGFPESHAASFALIAYASAYLKCHYLAAFTAALLNNQPMGFYHPSTVVKDAQRHGLKMLPADVTRSEWNCTLEVTGGAASASSGLAVRLGLRYARGLHEASAGALVAQRKLGAFRSIRDLVYRVPELRHDQLRTLASIGALNEIPVAESEEAVAPLRGAKLHRRDALWQVERAVRRAGPLLDPMAEPDFKSPLQAMDAEERLQADFHGTGLTVGPHPMSYHRATLRAKRIRSASELNQLPSGMQLRVAGCVIARQRPGTAKGFVFLSLEDESGVSNAIIHPELFQKHRLLITTEPFLMVEGILQNQGNVISVQARRVEALSITQAVTTSHDFH
ncbi:MAG: error-prone DNA polymerase, partial [Acidobacteriales bacterium]|nr:error-prone DNA polymerase [Terriglobales bacterium]